MKLWKIRFDMKLWITLACFTLFKNNLKVRRL